MSKPLAIFGGPQMIETPRPHFSWPPPLPELAETVAAYIRAGRPLSIIDRSGIYAELEDRFATLHGRRYAVATSSGTMALYSAFFGLDLQPGDEVISTVYSFHATATPLLHLGVQVVFCDVEADTGNIDPASIEPLITSRTRAILTNDMWGHPVAKAAVGEIARRHDLAWVEDCSHAHFAEYEGKPVGSFGDVAVWSLQGNKLLTGGEGGILLTDSVDIYERATLLGHGLRRSKNCVRSPQWQPIAHTGFGLKLRMHPLAAVIVLHMLEHHSSRWLAERNETLQRFSKGLSRTGWVRPMARRAYVTSMGAHYGFKPRIDFEALGVTRERLIEALQAEGLVVSLPGSQPFHKLALFDPERFTVGRFEKHDNRGRAFPGAEAYYASILSLPTFTFRADWPLVDAYVAAFEKVFSQLEALR